MTPVEALQEHLDSFATVMKTYSGMDTLKEGLAELDKHGNVQLDVEAPCWHVQTGFSKLFFRVEAHMSFSWPSEQTYLALYVELWHNREGEQCLFEDLEDVVDMIHPFKWMNEMEIRSFIIKAFDEFLSKFNCPHKDPVLDWHRHIEP